jgi:ABC-2 type transport system ATP-binding protein
MIRFENVTKLYKSVIGVNDINLTLEPGAYGLLGPNGSGKTTLINLILGQLRPTIGVVRTFGDDPWENDQMLRRIGICPAIDVLYPNVTALEWVSYLVQLHGVSRIDASAMAEQALDRVGMSDAMNRVMGGYSLGMRQRAKLAQAFAHGPDLLILDEPFNGLDPIGRHEMTEMLQQWIRDGKSLLLASHILHEVEALRPSLLLISGGRVLASGSADEVNEMLADLPSEIHLKCDAPEVIAKLAMEAQIVESVKFDGSGSLTFATQHPMSLYRMLPQWVTDSSVTVDEIRSNDESLQDLFTSLMRIHRGER